MKRVEPLPLQAKLFACCLAVTVQVAAGTGDDYPASRNQVGFRLVLTPSQVVIESVRPLTFCIYNLGRAVRLEPQLDQFTVSMRLGAQESDLLANAGNASCTSVAADWTCALTPSANELVLTLAPASRLSIESGATRCFEVAAAPINAEVGMTPLQFARRRHHRRAWLEPFREQLWLLKTAHGLVDKTDMLTVVSEPVRPASSFAELTGTLAVEQIPDDLSVKYSTTAGDAQTLSGKTVAQLDRSVEVEKLQSEVIGLNARLARLENLLGHFSRNGDDVYLTGANLHIVNGVGKTESTNGYGNVIIGYNEPPASSTKSLSRRGSHMLVVGSGHEYGSFGGIVVGYSNQTNAPWSSVTGGSNNKATGEFSWIGGGIGGNARGASSAIAGGDKNVASGVASAVLGGLQNDASANHACVSGGEYNVAGGSSAAVSGGMGNQASGGRSAISGGKENVASGLYSAVSGGQNNLASGPQFSWVGGGVSNRAEGVGSTIAAGLENVATGQYAAICGGCQGRVSESCASKP